MKMARITLLILLVLAIQEARGQMDEKFCTTFFPSTQVQDSIPEPRLSFPINVQFRSERHEGNVLSISDHEYCAVLETVKSSVLRVDNGKTRNTTYYTVAEDEETKVYPDDGICRDLAPNKDLNHGLRFSQEGYDTTQLESPAEMVGWKGNDTFIVYQRKFGGLTTFNGIKAIVWYSCNYDSVNQKMVGIKWTVSDNEFVTMPIGYESVLLKKEISSKDGLIAEILFDAVKSIPSANLIEEMEKPSGRDCSNSTIMKSLPYMPSFLSFEGERFMYDLKKKQNSLVIFKEIYDYEFNLAFIREITSTTVDGAKEKAVVTSISDFNTGTTYTLDEDAQECKVANTISEPTSSIAISGGHVQMRTPRQFFDFDSDRYEYTGLRMHRGYECDTWEATFDEGMSDHPQGTTYRWFFMSQGQLERLDIDIMNPQPVALTTSTSENSTTFDIFSYRTKRASTVPINLDVCFTKEKGPSRVSLTFAGNYTRIVSKGLSFFNDAFVKYIQIYAGIGTPLRISNPRLSPNPENLHEFFVQFKIYPRTRKGNVQVDKDNVETEDAIRLLRQQVDSSGATVGVVYPDQTLLLTTAKAGSTVLLDVHSQPKEVKSAGSSSSSGYSSGSMTGLAFGMVALGFLLGFGSIFLFKRYRSSESNSPIVMREFDESRNGGDGL